tara:strand:- start:401 stop:619 length:219 start_codon:yes stop_codon:yes gene_type:complete
MMEHVPVNSSNLKSVGYNEDEEILEVMFNSGALYRYEGVPKDEYYGLVQADSVGRYFNKSIKSGGYPYEKVG